MTQGPSNSDESVRIQETLISIGAKISQSIREAVEEAADNIDATVAQRVGRSLVTTFTNLAKFSQDTANNAFKIGEGLLTSEGISKQLLDLEEKKLTLARQKQLAELAGIVVNQQDYLAALDSITAQELILENEKAITDEVQKKIGLTGKLAGALKAVPGLGKLVDAKQLEQDLRKAAVQVDANGNIAVKNVGKFAMMGKGIQLLGKQIATSLFDPLTIGTLLVKKFLEFNKAAVDVQRLTGQIGTSFDIMANGAASATQILETAAELTKEIGFNAEVNLMEGLKRLIDWRADHKAEVASRRYAVGLSD
jgi:flagellar biosynthesis chaperone FliJ